MIAEQSGVVAIHGWGCTPTGDALPSAIAAPSEEESKQSCLSNIFTSGWRRTTLYCILTLLMFLIFLNIALTLWIISALKLSMDGIGPIKIVRGGIHVDGEAWMVDNLVASSITSRGGQPITLHSHRNFSALVNDPATKEQSQLLLKRDSIEFSGRSLNIADGRGSSVFRASHDEVRVFADTFAVDGQGGLSVHDAVQTPRVRAPSGSNLTLESLTRRLDLRAPQSIYFESRAGGIDVTSHTDIKLISIVGAVKIDAPNIILSNLKEVPATDKPQKSNSWRKKVYQLCACASGKLFLAAPEAPCASTDDDTELCR